ncbi:MAG: Fic family protein [Myxococcales bacterium]|nr:Fic family protein [Myxococcales bacterium]
MPKLVRQRWEADFGAFGGRKAKRGFSYDAYVPDELADLEFSLTADVAQAVAEAELLLTEVNRKGPALRALEALARQLLRAESVASSRIEGLELSHRRLARAAFAEDESDITAQSVLANIRAMELAVATAATTKRFGVPAILKVHKALFSAFGDRHAGKVRTEQNWVGGAASSPRNAEFVPPPPELVTGLLEDLAAFLDRDDLPPVMQAAIAHAQFETIHPFADGNGRVGRCLIHVVLTRRGVTPNVVPPVSLVLATDARAYVGGLTDFRAGRVNEWVGLFAAAARTAAMEASRFAAQLSAQEEQWRAAVGPLRPNAAASVLLRLLPGVPIIDVQTAQELVGCSNQAARLALAQLERAGVISQLTVGRRNRAWEAGAVFELLNTFERHLATRRGGTTRLRPAPR